MRAVFFVSLLATGIFGVSYWYTATSHICPIPITYKLGTLDERFAIDKTELTKVLADAELVWEKAAGEDLFVYDEDSDFAINLIFDERQQLASTEEEWRINLDQKQEEYETLLAKIKTMAERYQIEEASYNTRREEYEAKLSKYNAEVEKYNNEGGAPPEVYAKLKEEADHLGLLLKEFSPIERKLNQMTDEINQLGEKGNAMISAYNAEVEEYNEIFGTLETFTQGDYERTRINIYKFTDAKELTQVIAHEFGHALGVGHVEGEESVMYYLMTERDFSALSETDVVAFKAVCGDSQTFKSKLRQSIRTVLQKIN
jgi:hypothetical protein